jgi:cell division protein FtsL
MTRLNALLLAVLVACALGSVTAQQQARKLVSELEAEQERAKRFEVELGQLILEQSTWATPSRVERIARRDLGMTLPDASRIQVVPAAEAAQ